MSVYLGFDVSPLRIGAAAVNMSSKPSLMWAETFTFDQAEWITPADRAETIEMWHEKYGDEPKAIGLEAVFIGPNKLGGVRAAMALGHIESICDYEWPESRQKVLTATQWRKLCGIKQGGKPPVMEWALDFAGKNKSRIFKIEESQDTADAIAIAYAVGMWDKAND